MYDLNNLTHRLSQKKNSSDVWHTGNNFIAPARKSLDIQYFY